MVAIPHTFPDAKPDFEILKTLANSLRVLSLDMVERAKSGHPGLPLGFADVMATLWARHMKYSPEHPTWPDRDRFVLSAGHGSALLYATHAVIGTPDMTISQLKNFRQWQSLTPGHPEYRHTPGVETTTGPLGQGLANAVGMAIAEARLAAEFGADLVDHKTYVVVGDGCLMEGLSQEAFSLAGHLRLKNLIVLFDDNGITIDGPTALTHSENTLLRLQACGWAVLSVDGLNIEAIDQALTLARQATQPTFIAFKTQIGFGAPTKAGTAAAHGSPLGPDEAEKTRKILGWSHAPFEIPASLTNTWRLALSRNAAEEHAWRQRCDAHPQRQEFARRLEHTSSAEALQALTSLKRTWQTQPVTLASRLAFQQALEATTPATPEFLGGSADLTPSNNTKIKTQSVLSAENYAGRYLHYGVREHAMAAIMNGLALHGGLRPFGGTFLVFSDYARPAIRLSAMMQLPVIYIMTHDSIGLGEDGPTHQPIEHLMSLRAIPGLHVYRPADAIETAECWELALTCTHAPALLALSRQNLPSLRHDQPQSGSSAENLSARGGYVLFEPETPRQVTLIATGSEVAIAWEAQKLLAAQGVAAAVISLPCWARFDQQSDAYRNAVLRPETCQVTLEAGITLGWQRYLGPRHHCLGLDHFGASAPAPQLYEHFGLTAQAAVDAALQLLRVPAPGVCTRPRD